MADISAYGTLFLVAFLAATLIPAQSEATLIGFTATKNYPTWMLVSVASIGNVLGSILNWWLGLRFQTYSNRKWFPVKQNSLLKAQQWYQKHGRWSLLASWVPFIGDPITIAAGTMREKFLPFLVIVGTAKTFRYLAVVGAFLPFNHT